jgi:AcrR family transcriptional regulator
VDELMATEPGDDAAAGRRSVRMPPEQRKRALLEQAIAYFSEEGFDVGTRELAKRMGITQPLIYRYFPSKEDLINEVYRAVYLAQWQDGWTLALRRRDVDFAERLTAFYRDYTRAIFNRPWMRIFFFAALKGLDINTRYIERVVTHLLVPIAEEARAAFGLAADRPVTTAELDLVWTMHGAIFYQGIREHVYQLPGAIDHDRSAAIAIAMYLGCAEAEIAAILADPDAPAAAGPRPQGG